MSIRNWDVPLSILNSFTHLNLIYISMLRNFRQQPQQRPKKNTLVIGKSAVIQALQSGKQLERIYLQDNIGIGADEVRKLATQLNVPINKVPV